MSSIRVSESASMNPPVLVLNWRRLGLSTKTKSKQLYSQRRILLIRTTHRSFFSKDGASLGSNI